MGHVVKCCFKANNLFQILTRSATFLAHTKGPTAKEEADAKKGINDVKIDRQTIAKLERISLVDFNNEGGIQRLEAAIRFAQKLKEVPLDSSVKPMYSVLEDQRLELREDEVTENPDRKKILRNAKITEDEYFVAPPGNIPKSS